MCIRVPYDKRSLRTKRTVFMITPEHYGMLVEIGHIKGESRTSCIIQMIEDEYNRLIAPKEQPQQQEEEQPATPDSATLPF